MQEKRNAEVETFYDNFQRRLVQDYLLGNERIVGAIAFIQQHLYPDCRTLLDIGCGLGWSSYEFARLLPRAQVIGVDLSGALLATARRFFSRANLSFRQVDITSQAFSFDHTFDAITLIDVYEHVPLADRAAFHQELNRQLSSAGQLFLTCPTMLHQQWLREHHPAGLQPVDEDVTLEALQELARDVQGQLIIFQYVSVWRTNDYFHALIERNPQYQEDVRSGKIRITPKWQRLWRTLRHLRRRENPLFEPVVFKFFLKTFFRNP